MSIVHVFQGGIANQALVCDDCKADNKEGTFEGLTRHHVVSYAELQGAPKFATTDPNWWIGKCHEHCSQQEPLRSPLAGGCEGGGTGVGAVGEPNLAQLFPQFSGRSFLGLHTLRPRCTYPTNYDANFSDWSEGANLKDRKWEREQPGATRWRLYGQDHMETGEETDQSGQPFSPECEMLNCLCPRGWTKAWCR
jgi:hypothetical protein